MSTATIPPPSIPAKRRGRPPRQVATLDPGPAAGADPLPDPWLDPDLEWVHVPTPLESPPGFGPPAPRQADPDASTSGAFIAALRHLYGPGSRCEASMMVGQLPEARAWLDGLDVRKRPPRGPSWAVRPPGRRRALACRPG